jgi:predicted nucleic acid-binding protein
MLEYESVLTRPEHLEAAGLHGDDIEALLDAIAEIASRVRLAFLWRPVLPDSRDDIVLETAVNGRADVLVTLNRRHFDPAARRFGIMILSPAEAVGRMGRAT